MNTKILASLIVIGLVASTIGLGTYAYFSDIETSTGNTFTAGTIDIAIDEQNPWVGRYSLEDMKPSTWKYIEFDIKNVGGNPVVLWKHLRVMGTDTGKVTEPECTDQGGLYASPEGPCAWNNPDKNDIDTKIDYDLIVGDKIIFAPEEHIKISDINSMWMPLGTLAQGDTIHVKQSYHLESDAGNEYQGDVMTFDIEIYGEQLLGPGPSESTENKLFLDNKDGDPNWNFIADGMWGLLKYGDGATFKYTFEGHGLMATTEYCLIYYADPWPGNNPGKLIDAMTTNGSGNVNKAGDVELNMDIPALPDANYPVAKIWLVPCADYDKTGYKMKVWNWANYLFEANKITYDDTGV